MFCDNILQNYILIKLCIFNGCYKPLMAQHCNGELYFHLEVWLKKYITNKKIYICYLKSFQKMFTQFIDLHRYCVLAYFVLTILINKV